MGGLRQNFGKSRKCSLKRSLLSLGVFFLTLLLVGGLASIFVDKDLTRLKAIQVVLSGGSQETALFKGIEADLSPRLAPFMSESLLRLSLRDVLREVYQDGRVQSARVRRVFPGKLEIVITPHQPVLVYLSARGELFPIARDGTLLPRASLVDIPDVPILRGGELAKEEGLKARRKAVALLEDLPDRGLFSQLQLSEIHFQKEEGFELILLNGLSVLVGQGDLGLKASQIEQVMKYLNEEEIGGRVIDARFSKKVVVKLRHQL